MSEKEEEEELYAGDKRLAVLLKKVVDQDLEIDGLKMDLVEKLDGYQTRYLETGEKIEEIKKILEVKKSGDIHSYEQRLASNFKRRKQLKDQIILLKRHLNDLVSGS